MNEYIFYTNERFTIPPHEEKEVENCQVLGRAFGDNEKNACDNLVKDNPWIKDCGFDIEKAVSMQLLTKETKQDINILVQYLIEDEYRKFQELGSPKEHIYHSLKRLQEVIG